MSSEPWMVVLGALGIVALVFWWLMGVVVVLARDAEHSS